MVYPYLYFPYTFISTLEDWHNISFTPITWSKINMLTIGLSLELNLARCLGLRATERLPVIYGNCHYHTGSSGVFNHYGVFAYFSPPCFTFSPFFIRRSNLHLVVRET